MTKKQKLLVGLLSFLVLLLILILIIAPKVNTVEMPKTDDELGISKIEDKDMSEEEKETYIKQLEGVEHILLIGIDGDDYKNARSDVMIIATIDHDNTILKLTSVMRDTYVQLPTSESFQKLNHSYSLGGPVETVKAINKNLDLNIKEFVTFNYTALKEAVDFIGGFPVYVNSGEAKDMNITEGSHNLFGDNALNYVRVRKNSGGDPGRNERQRELILYIMNQTKKMSKGELLKFAQKMVPLVETSYSYKDIEELVDLFFVVKNDIEIEQYSFPTQYFGGVLSDRLWYAVPKNLEHNVRELHASLYGPDSIYVPSMTLQELNNIIEFRTGVKIN